MAPFLGLWDDDEESEAVANGTHSINGWKLTRMWWFHICKDTKQLLWPLTKAYYSDEVDITIRLQLRGPSVATWITPAAYTYRKLQE